MILYNLRTSAPAYTITKFDDDFNHEASYIASAASCSCPQGFRPSCRHRKMLPIFLKAKHEDTNWFYCFDDRSWHEPITEAAQ